MQWPDLHTAYRLSSLPNGYRYEVMRRPDVPVVRASVAEWHPDVSVGATSCYLEQTFYETSATLAGEVERDLLIVLVWKDEEFVGFVSWDRERAQEAFYARFGVISPAYRGAKLPEVHRSGCHRRRPLDHDDGGDRLGYTAVGLATGGAMGRLRGAGPHGFGSVGLAAGRAQGQSGADAVCVTGARTSGPKIRNPRDANVSSWRLTDKIHLNIPRLKRNDRHASKRPQHLKSHPCVS